MKTYPYKKLVAGALALVAFVSVGCTKQRPYDKKDGDATSLKRPELKNTIDTNAKYLYVPSSLNSTRTTDATFPMYMGATKVVKLQFTEDALKVVEVDSEDRFAGNPVNAKPVLSIPVANTDFKCTTDADGKCTNKEEEDESKPWAQRRFYRVDADKMAVQEVGVLPVEIRNLFQSCYDEVGSDFVSYKAESDAINLEVEKTYKTSVKPGCVGKINDLSDLTFKVVYHYSLVKLDSVTTPGYKALSYARSEESTFGFFDTNTLRLDRDNNSMIDGEKVYLNRWNPTKTVVYHLTENFNKPENAVIKTATYAAIASMNKTLEKAGATMRLELQDALPDMNPGDIRVNSIVMVEDPVNYGILGYGPTAANPETGEIVHGRTAMYLGVMKTGIRRAYEDLVKEKLSAIEAAKSKATTESSQDGSGDVVVVGRNEQGKFSLSEDLKHFDGTGPELMPTTTASVATVKVKNIDTHTPINLNKLASRALRLNERKLSARDIVMMNDDKKIAEQILSTNCFFSTDDFNINDAIEEGVDNVIKEVGAKPWLELSDEEKEKVIDALLPFVWVPTLIHEMGHNLGLRHNFAGSEDKDNFYTEKELSDMGIKRQFAYSSVMDYGYHSTKELQVMGKYDIAALRFAYAEKVELKDGSLMALADFRAQKGAELKPYKYCTDEHVDVNPNCNRFDEGSTLVEMANHWMTMYEEMYARRSFRNGLRNFSLMDDDTQISRISNIMDNLRSMYERYDDIKQTFGLADDAPEWASIDFLKDLKESSRIAGNFFIQVLETPDTLCAAAKADAPNMIVGVVPLRALSPFAATCFDEENVQLNPAYVIVGEAGKSFQSRKDPRMENPYIDQIDVRGIWIDKLLALNALTGRLTGIETFDTYSNNFLDLTDMRPKVQAALSNLLLDQVVTQVPIYTVSGQVLVAELPVQMYDASDSQNGHIIPKPLHPGVQALFNIPDKGINFQVELVRILKATLPSREQSSDATSLLNSISASAGLPVGSTPQDFLQADIGLQRFFVNTKSQVAAIQVISREVVMKFTALGEAKLKQIADDLAKKKPAPKKMTDLEKYARSMGKDVIAKFLNGEFQDTSFYEQMIQVMAM